MSTSLPVSAAKAIRQTAAMAGLRFCKHRGYCFRCKGLKKFVVGGAIKPRCAECLFKGPN